MGDNHKDDLIPARKLVDHVRRCCTALVDGTIQAGRRKPAYWGAKVSADARYWRYPVLTADVIDCCSQMGISINDEIKSSTGIQQLSALLKALENPLREELSSVTGNRASQYVNNIFEPDSYRDKWVCQLPDIYSPLQKKDLPGVSLYLHGSMADLTFTPFSDVDDLLILQREAWQDPDILANTSTLLARVSRSYQDIDPLQHHGHWVLTEFDLMLYNQSFLPLVVLENAVRIVGSDRIEVRQIEDYEGFKSNAKNTIRGIARTYEAAKRNGGLNAFELKGLVGEISILPAYMFQTHGEILSKPEAIRRGKNLYSPHALKALAWATHVRQDFAPVVKNTRTRNLSRLAKLTCPRRYQAEALFCKHASWVSNNHKLGLNSKVMEAIELFITESHTWLSGHTE